jgi:hypothetical protein
MSGYAAQVFPDHELADLHPIDILNIQAIYGAGRGHVYPLGTPPPSPAPEPASIVLFGSGLALAARSRLRRDASRRSRR